MKLFSKIKKLFKSSKYTKKIYIDNIGFVNKGDQLMIMSVVEQIRKFEPKAQILVRESVFMQNPTFCIQNKLYPLASSNTGLRHSHLYKFLINRLSNDDWIVTPKDIDVILDCRGYHLADVWIQSQEYIEYIKGYYSQFSKKGRLLYLLPQSLGPFSKIYSQEVMALVCKEATRIYAREEESYKYVESVIGPNKKLAYAPDFTCLLPPPVQRAIVLPEGQYALLIPNFRMIDSTANDVSGAYVEFMVNIAKFLLGKGMNIYFLNFAGNNDEELCSVINGKLENKCPIISNLSGEECRAIIAEAKLVISGRYHGVVCGLTQGVPTLCTGWSHKYQALLREHKCENNILNVQDLAYSKGIIDKALQNPINYSSKAGCNAEVMSKSHHMWEEIFREIKTKCIKKD